MKKTIFVFSILVVMERVSFAGTGVPGGDFTFKQSSRVSVQYDTDVPGSRGKQYYLNIKHDYGDKVFSSSNATSNIWYKIVDKAATASAGIQTAGESTYSGWSSQ